MLSILNINICLHTSRFNKQFLLFILQKNQQTLTHLLTLCSLCHLLSGASSVFVALFPPYFILSFHGDSLFNY